MTRPAGGTLPAGHRPGGQPARRSGAAR